MTQSPVFLDNESKCLCDKNIYIYKMHYTERLQVKCQKNKPLNFIFLTTLAIGYVDNTLLEAFLYNTF